MRIILSHYLRSLHYNIIGKFPQQQTRHRTPKRIHSASSSNVASNNLQWKMKWSPMWMATGAGLAMTLVSYASIEREADMDTTVSYNNNEKWISELEAVPGTIHVENPRNIIKQNHIIKNTIASNHMFEKMTNVNMIEDIKCFYNKESKIFHSAVKLGKDVCGYPNTVHGGLTAAVIDETLGGLMVNLWKSGSLGLSMPAVTARLEVDYCARVPHDSLLLCSAKLEKIEGRKLWMTAELKDSPSGIVYANAKALFVSPSFKKTAIEWLSSILLWPKKSI